MSVHYKFKSAPDKYTVIFDGLHISVADLKKEIMKQRKIGKSADLDLQITNSQTKEIYQSDGDLIPKNSSVEVARVPVAGVKRSRERIDMNNAIKGNNSPSHVELEKITKSSNISTSYSTEEEKIKAMVSQSTQDYDPSKYMKNRGPIGPLPANYTCYRCGNPGHYIKQCPTNNIDVKRSTGIPRSFMIPASAEMKGALLTASGDYAVPIIDHQAYKEVKKEKPPFVVSSEPEAEVESMSIPDELKCGLCYDLLNDAVMTPCCAESFCDECVRNRLLESETHECPHCHDSDVSPDTLIPNRKLRTSVNKFKNDTGYSANRVAQQTGPTPSDRSDRLPVTVHTNQIQINVKPSDSPVNSHSEARLTDNESKAESPAPEQQSPIGAQTQGSADVTMDEVIMSSSAERGHSQTLTNGQSSELHNSIGGREGSEGKDLTDGTPDMDQPDSATGANTPLIDEASAMDESMVPMEGHPVASLASYPPQMMQGYPRPVRMMGPIRPIRTLGQQQSAQMIGGRPPTVMPHPRPVYSRTGPQPGFRPMTDARGYSMPMGHTMPYPYPPQMRPSGYEPYGYMGPRSHMMSGGMMHMGMPGMDGHQGAPMMGDSHYYTQAEYEDYEDRLNRFTKQLESRSNRSRGRKRRRSTSRSRRSSSSSSSSSSGSSSSSSSSRSSISFSSSRSRSRSFNARRRSRSRSHYRGRRSRSRSWHRDYRPRRSRSPIRYIDGRRYTDRVRYDRDKDRNRDRERDERDDKYRNSRNGRSDRNETSRRSSHRSGDKKESNDKKKDKDKDSKAGQSKSKTDKDKDKDKSKDDKEKKNKRSRSKTPVKDEIKVEIKEEDIKMEDNSEENLDTIDIQPQETNDNLVVEKTDVKVEVEAIDANETKVSEDIIESTNSTSINVDDKDKTEKSDKDKSEKSDKGKDKSEKSIKDVKIDKDKSKDKDRPEKSDKDKSAKSEKDKTEKLDKDKDKVDREKKTDREKLDKDKERSDKDKDDDDKKKSKSKDDKKSKKHHKHNHKDKDKSEKSRDDKEKDKGDKKKPDKEKTNKDKEKDKERSTKDKEDEDKKKSKSRDDRKSKDDKKSKRHHKHHHKDKEKSRDDKEKDKGDKRKSDKDKSNENKDKDRDRSKADRDRDDKRKSTDDKKSKKTHKHQDEAKRPD